ncbi:MAG: hypothetical protein HFI88_01605 [Lachnospiraceae bacterium]|nr:hypothetical protein [Lachnospiraceae bacterium]
MKRIRLVKAAVRSADLFSADIVELMTRLKLLYKVPFSYLVTGEHVLPPESLRFFVIDGNWTDALVQGALSLGRASGQDGVFDQTVHRMSAPVANRRLRQVRLGIMHENHKRGLEGKERNTASEIQTGFLLRSALVRRMKGLEITGKSGDSQIEILRMETLADDIMICIFDGELTDLVIAEPQTGLRFGSPDDSRVIQVRSVADDGSFGKYRGDTVDLHTFTQENGKLDVSRLAKELGNVLGQEIGAAEWAFELMAVAHRAEFIKNETVSDSILRGGFSFQWKDL